MKIAVAGKGGAGKTLLTGTLAHLFAKNGYEVLAIDNDPSMNLALSIGIPPEVRGTMTPISKMNELLSERTSAGPGTEGSGIYNVNPQVSDIPEQFIVLGPNGIKLLALGTVEQPQSGCMCSGNAVIRALLYNLFMKRNEVVLVDFEAGLEHLGRGTAKGVDLMVIVTEPSQKSWELSLKIAELAKGLDIKHLGVVFNKVQNEEQLHVLEEQIAQDESLHKLGLIPMDEAVVAADLRGDSLYLSNPECPAVKAIESVFDAIISLVG
jgi:CO dehydrogenase maturation factor